MSKLKQYTKLTRSIDLRSLIEKLPSDYVSTLALRIGCTKEHIRQVLPPRPDTNPKRTNDKVIEAAIILAEEETNRINLLKSKLENLDE